MNDHVNDAFQELLQGITESHSIGVSTGAMAVRLRLTPAINALEQEFKGALDDEKTVMKSSLQVAIANVIAIARAERANEYAEVKVKVDQARRHEGRPEHDTTTWGAPLKAGS